MTSNSSKLQSAPATLQAESTPLPDPTSFETVPSTAASTVFTNANVSFGSIQSDDTSVIDSLEEESQDLFPTQDYDELMSDEDFRKSFTKACAQATTIESDGIVPRSPFKAQAWLPSNVPFWYFWEIHRAASCLESSVPLNLYTDLQKSDRLDSTSSFEELWGKLRARFERNNQIMPPKSEWQQWTTLHNKYENLEMNKVTYLTATLDWQDDPTMDNLFKFRLNEVHLEQSCRLHRKFGADRFLVVSAPVFSMCPEKVRKLDKDGTPLHKKILDSISTEIHSIAGRKWRLCYAEQDKSKARAKKQESPRFKFVLFAESGYDIGSPVLNTKNRHQVMMLEEVARWHLQIDNNLDTTHLKLFSRWGIGFSKTTPTVVLEQDQFKYLHDERGVPVMNDGCALMSYPLAKAIWAKYGGEGEPPSAVQGRIAGAKGVWIVDYHDKYKDAREEKYWIEVSDSQLKIKPHPRDWHAADVEQRTFEVLKYAGECRKGHLNLQLVTILEDRGIPRSVLQQALESDIRMFSDSLKNDMKNPVSLRSWLHKHGQTSLSEGERRLGSFPIGHKEQTGLLLESGFSPQDCEIVVQNMHKILSDYLSNYLEKMWIQVPHSTVVFCVPDPLGVLAEDEVYLGFSSPKEHPETGLIEWWLDNVDVVVARNPAYLPSDMQKRRAVYKRELRHYRNVIIFPTRGQTPLASLLSGGDYDGDTTLVIWDQDLVRDFQNANLPNTPIQEECRMVQKSRPLKEIFYGERPLKESFMTFNRDCVTFNASPSFMGQCSVEHEKLVYALSQRQKHNILSHSGAVKLAALAGYLVDSNKQGWSLEEKAWIALRREASGGLRLERPAWKEDIRPRNVGANVIDFLKFDVAHRERDVALTEFKRLHMRGARYDGVLSQYWKDALWRAEAEKQRLNDDTKNDHTLTNTVKDSSLPALWDLLKGEDGLMQQIDGLQGLWMKLAAESGLDSSATRESNDLKTKTFKTAVRMVSQKFHAIQPKALDHEICRRYQEEGDAKHPFPYWSLLRASCLYYRVCHRGSSPIWVWYVAGQELCILKTLHHKGEVRLMTAEMRHILKVDSKRANNMLNGQGPMEEEETGEGDMEQMYEE